MNIELLKWSDNYLEDIVTVYNNIDRSFLSDRIPDPYTKDDALHWIAFVNEHEGIDAMYRMIVVDGRMAGSISLEYKSDVFKCDAEIGYLLSDEYKGRGIMTEVVEQLCRDAFRNRELLRVSALVYDANSASKRVLEKNGFVLEGVMRNAVVKNDNTFDLCIYGKLRD